MKKQRRSPEWYFKRMFLPPLERSKFNPSETTLSTDDLQERYLLSLTDEQFDSIFPKVEVPKDGGPVVTGDPVIDKLERELWEKSNGAVKSLRRN